VRNKNKDATSVSLPMGSHSITCHPTQVNTNRLNPSHSGYNNELIDTGPVTT